MTEQWTESPPVFSLAGDAVHVWLAHLPTARPHREQFHAVLSRDEVSRVERFHFPEHGERWQMTRGILRLLLAAYVETPACEITFHHGAHGKPELKVPAACGLHFNTSHSGDYAAFAFTRAGETGVDIERVRPDMPRRNDIVRRYFAPGEQRRWFALPESERVSAFFKLWTRKETFVKARGTGLFSGLDQFEVSLDAPRIVGAADGEDGASWWMAEFPPVPGYEGAVVVRAPSCTIRFWKWTPAQAVM